MTYVVKIDGITLPFANHQWRIEAGFAAPLQVWECPREVAADVVARKAGQEIELQLDTVTISRVIVLGNAPTDDPQTMYVVLADVRWYWTRAWLALDLNVPKKVGDTRVLGSERSAATPIVQDVQYAAWSINGAVPWTWGTGAAAILNVATAPKNGRPAITYVIDAGSTNIEPRTLQETITDSAMPAGVARAVSAVPGRGLYVDTRGILHVFDRTPGVEARTIAKLPPAGKDQGSIVFVSYAGSRWRTARVLFTPEYEVRCTAAEQTFGEADPFLENVVKVPDLTLDVPAVGRRAARTVGRNSYITHAEAYAAWGEVDDPEWGGALSDDVVRTHFQDGGLYTNYVQRGLPDGDPTWARRIDAVMDSYRTLYRVNPKFWARVRSALELMAAVWDEETGTRAPSPVYVNLARKPTTRWAASTTRTGMTGDASPVSYPTSGLLADGVPSGATVTIVDEDQGILRINLGDDPSGRTVDVAPSAIETPPDMDPATDPLYRGQCWNTAALVDSTHYALATILSLVPAAPNDSRRLYEVEVSIEEAANALGFGSAGLDAKGPDQELRTDLDTARFAWDDGQNTKDRVLAGFGADDPNGSVSATDPSLTPRSLVPVNRELELVPLARAMAAVDLFSKLDRFQGTQETPIDGSLCPLGAISVITHKVVSDRAVSVIECAAPAPPLNAIDLLPAKARKIIAREVQ